MKTERRHELRENELVHWLEQGRDYASGHAKQISIAVFGVVALVVVFSVYARSRSAGIEDLWRRLTELKFDTPEEAKKGLESLEALGKSSSDSAFTFSSFLQRGATGLKYARQGPNGTTDKEFNDHARRAFEELLRKFPGNALAFGSAHSGLATVEENEFVLDGNASHKEEARKHLKAILDRPELNTTPFHRMANDRIATLDSVFQKVVFAPAPPPPPPAAEGTPTAPITIQGGDDSTGSVKLTPLPGPPPGFENVQLPPPGSPPPAAAPPPPPPPPPPPAPAPVGDAKPAEAPKEGEKPKENP